VLETVPEPEAWAPIGPGDYEVGVTTITLDDPAGVRPLTVDVWFPIDAAVDVSGLAAQQYTLFPGVYYESPAAFAATAEQLASDAAFPLVVYSHGSGGLRFIHSSYTEALAAHGYVVVSADHTGNTVLERLAGTETPFEETAVNRPQDVRRLVDAFTDPTDSVAGVFATQVDAESVAVTGHSFGGYTAIASVTGVTFGDITVPADDRVDAIVPLAPAVGETLLTDELLASISVPFMVIVGSDDKTTPVDPNVTRLWDLSTVSPAYRIELVAGEHQTFTDLCDYGDAVPSLPGVPDIIVETITDYGAEGCSAGDIDDDRAAELVNTYVIEFLDQVFRGGPAIDPTLVAPPDDVIFAAR
jgi:predicted dienelactone hydrolase